MENELNGYNPVNTCRKGFMALRFEGPGLKYLLPAQVGAFFLGSYYSAIAKTNNAPVLIFMIREFVDVIFYQIASRNADLKDDQKQAKIYAGTNFCVNMGTLFFMRHVNLIANIGTAVFLALLSLELSLRQRDFKNYSTISHRGRH